MLMLDLVIFTKSSDCYIVRATSLDGCHDYVAPLERLNKDDL
jgi:hypothetical protein